MQREKGKMTAPLLLVLLLTIAYHAEANCPDDTNEYLYGCKAKDEEGQDLSCTCMKLQQKGKFNCTCFADDQVEMDEHYLDCNDALKKGERESGVYLLKPDNMAPFEAYCDMETDGGGWTVFQRRMDGSVDFYLNWADYVHGFGNVSEEHWLGLSKLHRLANGSVSTELRVDMKDKDGVYGYAKYCPFYIGGSSTDYTLHISGYSGPSIVGDSLDYHNGQKFTTKDNDNDSSSVNCAVNRFGAWWYNNCHYSNLNGHYGDDRYIKGVNWHHWKGLSYSLSFTEMKVRATCT